jgi:hypothetical protein
LARAVKNTARELRIKQSATFLKAIQALSRQAKVFAAFAGAYLSLNNPNSSQGEHPKQFIKRVCGGAARRAAGRARA